MNSIKTSCDFYQKCMEKTCLCENTSNNYAIAYGDKYCNRFLMNKNWTEKGKEWRDLTLRCLHEKAYLALPKNSSECNCKQLSKTAYNSHVNCYTKPFGNVKKGICYLPSEDIKLIRSIVDTKDAFFSIQGLNAALDIINFCNKEIPDEYWGFLRKNL